MLGASEMFVLEYTERPDTPEIFYEDTLMAAVFYGYPLLIENNKLSIINYFRDNGYLEYVMLRPQHLTPEGSRSTLQRGCPSTPAVIQAHAQALESYIYHHVGINDQTGDIGRMYFDRTLQDWSRYDMGNRTEFDATVSSGFALLAAQKPIKIKREKKDFDSSSLFRRYDNRGSVSKIRD
jgi:hypothetical protein